MRETFRAWFVNRILRFLRPGGFVRVFQIEEIESGRVFWIDETEINPDAMRVIQPQPGEFPIIGTARERLILFGDPDEPEPQGKMIA